MILSSLCKAYWEESIDINFRAPKQTIWCLFWSDTPPYVFQSMETAWYCARKSTFWQPISMIVGMTAGQSLVRRAHVHDNGSLFCTWLHCYGHELTKLRKSLISIGERMVYHLIKCTCLLISAVQSSCHCEPSNHWQWLCLEISKDKTLPYSHA